MIEPWANNYGLTRTWRVLPETSAAQVYIDMGVAYRGMYILLDLVRFALREWIGLRTAVVL